MTTAESDELHRRIAVQESLGPALAWAGTESGWAGAYIDQVGGGVPVFTFVGDSAGRRERISELLPEGTSYRVELVSRTLSDLRDLQAYIVAAWDALAIEGVDLRAVGIDTMSNSVTVGVAGLSENARARLAAISPAIVPYAAKRTRFDACVSRANCASPMKGGLRITQGAGFCTSAYIGELNNSNPATLRVVTAGHCIEGLGGIGATWKHNNVAFGTATVESFAPWADADVGAITLANTGQIANQFYASSNTDIRAFTSTATLGEVTMNYFLCRSGASSNYLCGRVNGLDMTQRVENVNIEHQNRVDFDAIEGDSGGPYWLGNKLYGIHSDSDDETEEDPPFFAWYSPYAWASIVISNIDACLDADC